MFYNIEGIYISSVTNDFDGPPRQNPPDTGDDEYTYIVSDLTGCSATAISTTQINIGFMVNERGDNVAIAWNNRGSFAAPSGAPPSPGDPFAGGTLLSYGTTTPVAQTCSPNTHYYYKLFSYDPVANLYSSGVPVDATTCLNVTSFPFTESFDGDTFPPNCWSVVHEGNIPGDWTSSTYGW